MAENRNQNPGSGQQDNASGGIGGRTGPRFEADPGARNDASRATPNRDSQGQTPGKESERRPVQKNWTDGSGKL